MNRLTRIEREPYVYRTRIEHEPDYFKSIQEDPKRTETLSSNNPNRTRTQNFEFFHISNYIIFALLIMVHIIYGGIIERTSRLEVVTVVV